MQQYHNCAGWHPACHLQGSISSKHNVSPLFSISDAELVISRCAGRLWSAKESESCKDGRFAAQVSPCWDALTLSEQSETELIGNKFSRALCTLMYTVENKACDTTCQNSFLKGHFFPDQVYLQMCMFCLTLSCNINKLQFAKLLHTKLFLLFFLHHACADRCALRLCSTFTSSLCRQSREASSIKKNRGLYFFLFCSRFTLRRLLHFKSNSSNKYCTWREWENKREH